MKRTKVRVYIYEWYGFLTTIIQYYNKLTPLTPHIPVYPPPTVPLSLYTLLPLCPYPSIPPSHCAPIHYPSIPPSHCAPYTLSLYTPLPLCPPYNVYLYTCIPSSHLLTAVNPSFLEYEALFHKAMSTFKYQTVFCPTSRTARHLSPVSYADLPPCLQALAGAEAAQVSIKSLDIYRHISIQRGMPLCTRVEYA